MLGYTQLNEADFSGISSAAQEWRQLKAAYEGLGTRYGDQVQKRLTANWEGEAGAKAAHTVARNKQEISDAAVEAGRMAKLLDDVHHDLSDHQKKLQKFADGLGEHHLRIDKHGTISDNHPTSTDPGARSDPDHGTWVEGRNKLMKQKAGELEQILKAATDADTAAAAALRSDQNGRDDSGFNTKGHQTLDEAVDAQRDAQRASDLMKNGGSLTATQIDELNGLLQKHGSDPVFAEKFAGQTGAQGTLNSYMAMMHPAPTDGRAGKEALQNLQKNLGTTLGTASQGTSPAMEKFRREMRAANQQTFSRQIGPGGTNDLMGYQLNASLMANGEWDKDVLKTFGHDLVKYENDKVNLFGAGRESAWPSGNHSYGLINDDPMAGLMDGLGRNPEAAQEFLNGTTTGTDDGDVKNYDYLMKDREWHGGDEDKGHLGHALHAAATGHNFDQNPPEPPLPRSQEQADLMGRVMKDVAENQDLAGGTMSDSLGKMGAEYVGDLNRGLSTDQSLAEKMMPPFGAQVPFDPPENSGATVSRFMYAVGSDPEGNAALHLGQQQYSAQVINYHLHNPDAVDLSPEETIEKVAAVAGQSEGITSVARSDALLREGYENDKAFNDALQQGGKVAEGVISTAGAGLGAAGTGGAGTAAGWAAGAEAGKLVVGGIVDAAKQDTSMESSWSAATEYNNRLNQTHQNLTAGLAEGNVTAPPGVSEDEWRNAIEKGVRDGYGYARDDVDSYATNRPEEALKP